MHAVHESFVYVYGDSGNFIESITQASLELEYFEPGSGRSRHGGQRPGECVMAQTLADASHCNRAAR